MTKPRWPTTPIESHPERKVGNPGTTRNGHNGPTSNLLLLTFESSVRQWPERIALDCGHHALTYSELDEQANRWAHWLIRRGIGRDSIVGLCFEKSASAYLGILAALKAGAAYAPLDSSYPRERLAMMIEDAAPAIIITDKSLRQNLPVNLATFVAWDDLLFDLDECPRVAPTVTANDDDLGYVLFTSGSTGRPKGVAMRRGPLRNLIDWQIKNSATNTGDATLQFASLSFDVSFQEIFSTWATGGALIVPPDATRRDPTVLLRFIGDRKISRIFVPFVMLQQLAEAGTPPDCLREVITAGEQLQITSAIRRLFEQLPLAKLVNQYGPTEAHVVTSHTLAGLVSTWPTLPPIGRPIDNASIYVVSEAGTQAVAGGEGEIWIGGDCLARGYLGSPTLTSERFGIDPFRDTGRIYRTGDLGRWNPGGELEFLGRIDHQVKIRGFRVEPGEIETALCAHPNIREAAVVAQGDGPNERKLVAFVVSRTNAIPSDLRTHLAGRLPEYMIPATFIPLKNLPLTPSGKVDRRALPKVSRDRPTIATSFAPPQSQAEKVIAEIWCDVLGLDRVGVNDPFFDLGGHSLALARVHAKLRDRLDFQLPLAALFQYPTIAGIAAALNTSTSENVIVGAQRPRVPATTVEPIAIIGFAGRFPGADSVDAFWANLCRGAVGISRFSDDELRAAGIPDPLIADPHYAKARGIIEGPDLFDANFFGFQPREAEITDPQQRLFLETAWTALEQSGYVPERCRGRVGVFAGASLNTYLLHNVLSRRSDVEQFLNEFQSAGYGILVGNDKDYLATRVAFKLNLRGPAISIQTACSTSLVAVCEAVESLRAGACDMALAGGVSITFPQRRGALHQEGSITSPDGTCRPFDADAAGTVFGDGAAAVVLKRLSDAVADGDTIYSVIKGIGLSNDGSEKVSYLAPSIDGQAEAVARALAQAEIDSTTIGYIETHGTGTPMGDPIEVAALARVFRNVPANQCVLGSVKGNVGHLEAAAGVTGLIKAALAIHHHTIPGTPHFRRPNPQMDLDRTAFRVTAECEDWPARGGPRRAGVTSLGVGGTNAHVILEEAPAIRPSGPTWAQHLIVLSARSAAALESATDNLAEFLHANPSTDLADVAFTLQCGRRAFEHRRIVIGNDAIDVATALKSREPSRLASRTDVTSSPSLAFLFPGQGSQFVGMASGLYEAEPTFRATLDLCAEHLQSLIDVDIRALLFPPSDQHAAAIERLNQTAYTQPTLFAIEYSLAQMWLGWGLKPTAMFGHSIGEFVAACVGGVFSLHDAMLIVARRGTLIQACPTGAMLAIRANETEVRRLLPAELDVAAINSPMQTVVSGPFEAITNFENLLGTRGINNKRLTTSHAFHSQSLKSAVVGLRDVLRNIELRAPKIRIASCVTGNWLTDEQATSVDYWSGQLRQPVRCMDAVRTLTGDGAHAMLELGPGATLSNLARQSIEPSHLADAVPGLMRDSNDVESVLSSLGQLWLSGVDINWSRFHALSPRRRIALPTYPFERKRYWIEPPRTAITETDVSDQTADVPTAELAPAPPPTPSDRLVEIRRLFADLAGCDVDRIIPNANFFELGFDSLFLTQAVQNIQNRFGIRIGFRQLFENLSTPAALADHISRHAPFQQPVAAPAALSEPKSATSKAEAPTGFGALLPFDQSETAGWSDRQLQFLQSFISRYTKKTRNSKQHVQDHRREHADPRTVSGFTRLWKELVYPIVIDRSAGSRLWDIDGNEYIDLLNGFGPDMLGHSPPFVVSAVEKQLRAGYEVGPLSPLAGELARLVCELTGMDRASFVCTGSEAVQAALRAARTVTGRDKVVTFARDYHGNFDEVLLRPGDPNRPTVPSAPGVPGAAVSNMIVLDYGTPESLDTIRRLAPQLAAVLVEPVQSRRPEWQPREFLQELRAITAASDTCLIFDEVITGFRLHPRGAQALFDVPADLATYGKVVGGGMPIGVVAGRSQYMDAFDGGFWSFGDESFPEAGRTFFAGTFVRHPLALAAGIATLRHLRDHGPSLQKQLSEKADRFVVALNDINRDNGVAIDVVNCGSLLFFRNRLGSKECSLLFYLLRDRGVYLLEGFPSYLSTAHSDADIRQMIAAYHDAVREMRTHGFFGTKSAPGVTTSADDGVVPMTEAQRELWLAAQSGDDASRSFNETCTIRLRGPFDTYRFLTATQQLVARHESLRATFDASGSGQRFQDSLSIDIPLTDLSHVSADERDRQFAAIQNDEDRFVFDLAKGPLLRIKLIRLAPDDHAVVLTAHHIACDGWSYDVILHDLGELYSGRQLPPTASFRDYAEARDQSSDQSYWESIYRSIPEPADLPTDHPRPAKRTFAGNRVSLPLGATLSTRIRQFAAKQSVTAYATLLAAFQAVVHRLSRQFDLVIGIPTAGQTLGQYETLVGHCVNFLPLRQRLDANSSFADFTQQVRASLIDAFEHRDFTYVSLIRSLPKTAINQPLVSIGFNLDPELRRLEFDGLTAEVTKNPKHFTNLELHWNLVDAGTEYVLEAEYNTDLFDEASICRWTASYCELLDDVVERPRTRISDLRMMSATERRQMLVAWNQTDRPIPTRCVHELFEHQAQERPNAEALLWNDEAISYGELNRRANILACQLRDAGIGPDDPVAVMVPRCPNLIVALLGVLKAGGAYLPLDLTHPHARNRQLLGDANAKLIVVDGKSEECNSYDQPIVDLGALTKSHASNLPCINRPDNLAAVMYTSGSTGKPKGVMVTHRGMVRLLFNAGYCDVGPNRTLGHLAPIAFDAATFEIWGALLHGGRLAIYPDEVPEPAALKPFLQRYRVDTLWLTAGLFNAVVDSDASALSGIQQLLTGGEAMSVPHARRALAALPNTTIINGYGPTETTTFAVTHLLPRELPADWQSVPIGKPIGNTTVAVLDHLGRCLPPGIIGELYVGGAGVARGYVNSPTLSAERFVESQVPELPGAMYRTGDRVRWRCDGTLEYLGRFDAQVKIRGHRIEPGETESVLATHPAVTAAAVIVTDTGPDAKLVAYVVLRPDNTVDASELRSFLGDRLPAYMVPAAIVFLDQIPLTANGKLNRAALPPPTQVASQLDKIHASPRTDAERDVLMIWAQVLDQPELGIDDNFFDVGGHSLKAVELIAAIRDRLGHSLPLGTIYQAPTVAQFAAVIQNRLEAGTDSNLVPLHEGGSRPPLFMVAGVGGHVFAFHKFARLLGADQPTYGVKAIGVDGTRQTPDRIEDIAAEYVREITAARTDGPCVLAGYSIGAVVAFEVALQLRAMGREVPLFIAIDAGAPEYQSFSLLTRARLHFANLFVRGGGWRYLKQRMHNLADKLNWATGRGHRNAPDVPGLEMFSQEAITNVWVSLHKAYRSYRPNRNFDGQAVIIRADVLEDWDKFTSHDPLLGWGRWVSGSIAAHGLPVKHLDLFHEPTIHDLASLFKTAIARQSAK